MTISHVGFSYGGGNSYIGNPQSVTVPKPAGQNDDMFVAVIGCSNITYSLSGWTTIASVAYLDNINRRINVLVKRVTDYASEPASFTFAASTYPVALICCMTLRGVYYADPGYQIISVGNDYAVTRTLTGVTTLNPNAQVLNIPGWVDTRSDDSGGDPLGSWVCNTPGITEVYYGAGWDAVIPASAYFSGISSNTAFAIGSVLQVTAGKSPDTSWTRDNSYGGNSLGISLAINSEGSLTPPCTCNAICTNDCGANQFCTGNVPVCSNDFVFSNAISIGSIVTADDLLELETAINAERADTGRRFNATDPASCDSHTPGNVACTNNVFSPYVFSGVAVGAGVESLHYNNIKDANNEVRYSSGYGSVVTALFLPQSGDILNSVIKAVDVTQLQNIINETRNVCICDSHCTCDPSDCGCNGECPSDDYYYY